MKDVPIRYGSFTIERRYRASPARVYEAWIDPELKARWFVGPGDWVLVERTMDVREGGEELVHGRFGDGPMIFRCRYHAVIPQRRLVYAYDMNTDTEHVSTSLASVELFDDEGGTRMVFTEHCAFYDGEDGSASRQEGTTWLLDGLGRVLGA